MKPTGIVALAGVLPLMAGCVYLNTLYNARDRFEAGEVARLEGRPEAAAVAYDDAIRKAADAYRQEPDGRWSDDALYLMGRAYLRRNELVRARAALAEAVRISDDADIRRGASLHLGAALVLDGESSRALDLLNDAIRQLPAGALRAEGHYWRARLFLAQGRVDQGWWDLDQASLNDPRMAGPAHLARLTWGVERDDTARAAAGARGLLTSLRGADRVDSLETAVRRAAARWGPGPAAALLAPGRMGPWPPGPKDRILLARARLLVRAGDTLAAESEAGWVAEGVGPGALEARLLVAGLRLGRATSVDELEAVRSFLLPAAGQAEVATMAEDLRAVELLVEWGRSGSAPALFAAAELARDRLEAVRLARRLFLEGTGVASPWRVKSALAALALDPEGEEATALRGWIVSRTGDPYRRAAVGGDSGRPEELEALEARLRAELEAVVARARIEARRRDLQLRGDTIGGVP